MPVPADIIDALDTLDEQNDTTFVAKTELERLRGEIANLQQAADAANAKYNEELSKQAALLVALQARLAQEYGVANTPPANASTRRMGR